MSATGEVPVFRVGNVGGYVLTWRVNSSRTESHWIPGSSIFTVLLCTMFKLTYLKSKSGRVSPDPLSPLVLLSPDKQVFSQLKCKAICFGWSWGLKAQCHQVLQRHCWIKGQVSLNPISSGLCSYLKSKSGRVSLDPLSSLCCSAPCSSWLTLKSKASKQDFVFNGPFSGTQVLLLSLTTSAQPQQCLGLNWYLSSPKMHLWRRIKYANVLPAVPWFSGVTPVFMWAL